MRNFPNFTQSDAMDCGSVSLRIVAHFHGKKFSTEYLRDLCNISTEGVSMLDISRASELIGLRSLALRASYDDFVEKIPLPCIIHWDYSHFVVLYKVTGEKAYISDPRAGLVNYDKSKFCAHWKRNSDRGYVLVLEPGENFTDFKTGGGGKTRLLDQFSYINQFRGIWQSLHDRFRTILGHN